MVTRGATGHGRGSWQVSVAGSAHVPPPRGVTAAPRAPPTFLPCFSRGESRWPHVVKLVVQSEHHKVYNFEVYITPPGIHVPPSPVFTIGNDYYKVDKWLCEIPSMYTLRERHVVGPCWEKLKPKGPKFSRAGHVLTLIDFIRKRIARRRIEASLKRHLGTAPAPS